MKYFVFRNNTIERFFPEDYSFSGYDDISTVPADADAYVWFYQAPLGYDTAVLAAEIDGMGEKLAFVLGRADAGKTFIALTMDSIYDVPFTEDDHSLQEAVCRYNMALFDLERQHPNLKVIDITGFTRRYPATVLIDWKFWYMGQVGINPRLAADFSSWWESKLSSIAMKRRKCIVLDLDGTLWGGILGEDGPEGIKTGGVYPGNAYQFFQKALLELSRHGVILTVCSKNNEQDVMELWETNPFIVLNKEHFAAWRINWNDKAANIRELAEELNIGLDSMVFVDDSAAERELVRQSLPMVAVPDFPASPYELPLFFRRMVEEHFKTYSVTDEDRNKTGQYRARAARSRALNSFSDFDSYLKSLDVRIVVDEADDFNIPRIAQLTMKTNQFNLTARRYSDSDVRRFVAGGWKVWCVSVADKFGDDGISGCAMVTPEGEIDTFLLSCRVLGKGVETAFASKLLGLLHDSGLTQVRASYVPTAKNLQVKDFYEKLGFSCVFESETGVKYYEKRI